MNRSQLIAIASGGAGLAVAVALSVEFRNQNALREALLSLKSDVQRDAEQLTAIQRELAQLRPTAPQDTQDNELLRLRAETHQLRESLAELQQVASNMSNQIASLKPTDEPFIYPDATPRKEYTFRGFDTPQSALQSVLWALARRDGRTFKAGIAGYLAVGFTEMTKELPAGLMPRGMYEQARNATGYRVLEELPKSDDESQLKIFFEGEGMIQKFMFKKISGQWKLTGGGN